MNMKINIDKIRKQRRDKDFSQDYMAEILGISQSQYSRIESGRCKVDLEKINTIAKFLEVKPADIIDHPYSFILDSSLQQKIIGGGNEYLTTERETYLAYIQELKDDKEFLKHENLLLKKTLEKLKI